MAERSRLSSLQGNARLQADGKAGLEKPRPSRRVQMHASAESNSPSASARSSRIQQDSPLRHWLYAIHLMTSSKKGVSSHQIARELGITVKSAWFVTHRIREAMKLEPMAGMLKGELEADETYVGARKQRYPRPEQMGRGTAKKAGGAAR